MEKKFQGFLKKKKKWLYSAGVLAALTGGILATDILSPPNSSNTAYAITLPSGATQVGTINGAPVIKSPTDNMASQTFQDIISGLLEGTGNPPYIINQASWGSSTKLFNGQAVSSISSAASTVFGLDGFLPTDHAIEIPVGQKAYIQNVGTAVETASGKKIPISLAITVNSATDPDGVPYDTVIMGAKSQSSVITLAWGSVVRGGENTGGGQGEGGGVGGGSSDGTLMGYIESISYTLTFINSDTGQPLPNETLMPIKNSDIDANQLAEMDGNGSKGYVLSPDTALKQEGNGFRSTSDGTIEEDSSDLTANSYVVIKQYNSNLVQYQYKDGAHDHLDIVTAHFGDTPFKLEELLGGTLKIDKSTFEFGKTPWNSNYSFDKLLFDIINKDGKTVGTIKLDSKGSGESEKIPNGTYTIKERSTGWELTGQTVRENASTTIKAGETTTLKLENKAVVGQNTLKKVDKDTGTAQNGKADLKAAIYQLIYDDTSTGSAAHKKGDPVKWTDKPAPKLLAGKKVTSALVGGKKVEFGDAVVIDIDDANLEASVGNLALGKYLWKEIDAGEGYTVDPTNHTFEIKYKDEKTENVIAAEQTSKERAIDAAIKINKMFTLPENEGASGANDIEFVANPLEGTIAEPVTMITGVDPVTGDDGYALGNLVYGDWVLEEKSEPEGRKKIRPIFIHMETDAEKDILTISASYYEDFSKPFSQRKFALQDSSTEKNPNSEGTVGSVTSEKPTISLSTLHLNNNPDTPEVPTPPTPPTKDVTKTDGGESINEGNVALNSDFFYVLNSSILQPNRQDTNSWTINDDYDENFDRYNGWFKVYATRDFDKYKAGDELPNEWIKAEDKNGKVLFAAQQELKDLAVKQTLLNVVNLHKDKEVGFTIHASFYRFKDSDKVVNTFVETINDVKQDSNEVYTKTPKPEPHKFDLSKEKFDLTGDKLLDDDKEMKDRYEDSNKDPYNDKTDNNEKENINTTEVKPGQTLVYQLWLDTTPFDETSELTYLRMVDKYDVASVTVNKDQLRVYDAKGNDATKNFKFEDDGKGTLTISANVFKKAKNSKGEEVSIVDTEKIPLGQIYKIDAPMTVKNDVKAGTDIINTASQEWADSDGTEDSHITEKRVNKVPEGEAPKKEEPKNPVEKVAEKVLPHTGDSPTSIFIKVLGWAIVLGTIIFFTVRSKRNQQIVNDEEPF